MASSSSLKIKLLIDTNNARKVLFAEAGKDFVDFLLYLLSLPLASVAKLLKEKSMVGCITDLYGSIGNLNETYFQKAQINSKDYVLNHISTLNDVSEIPLLLSDRKSATRNFYLCECYYNNANCRTQVADVKNLICPACKNLMTKVGSYVSPTAAVSTGGTVPEGGGGFVKGAVNYMVTDGLEVSPMSTQAFITLMNKFNVRDVGELEEEIVDVGVDEGLKLLKASLECSTVLTKVFLGKKA